MRAVSALGILHGRPMFTSIEAGGVRHSDGSCERIDMILWATGSKADPNHLAPLHLGSPAGGRSLNGWVVVGEPRPHLVGYGAHASTVRANRGGAVMVEVVEFLGFD